MKLTSHFIEKKQEEFIRGKRRVVRGALLHPYDPAFHPFLSRKFLFWKDGDEGLLLVGNDEMHHDVVRNAKELGIVVPEGKPFGAGNLSIGVNMKGATDQERNRMWELMRFDRVTDFRDFQSEFPDRPMTLKVSQWSSSGFGCGTPRAFRSTLLAMISPAAVDAATHELDDEERAKSQAQNPDARSNEGCDVTVRLP